MYYYHIASSTMDPCELATEAGADGLPAWLCRGCKTPLPDAEPLDVRLDDTDCLKRRRPLTFISHAGLAVALARFLEPLGQEILNKDLQLGPLFDCQGRLLEDWVTFRGRSRLIVRGSKHAGCRVCQACGRNLYFAMGKQYLFPKPPDDIPVFESDLNGLIVLPELFEKLETQKWRGLEVTRLPVLQEPRDSLGVLPFYS